MWLRALQIIPRITPAEWRKLDLVSRWLIASRGAVLVITFISVGIAGLLAIRDGGFDLAIWSLVAAGLLLAHATNNLINDLTDHARGVDRDNYFRAQYGPHPLEHGLMNRRELVTYAAVTGLVALLIGAYLVATRGPLTLPLLAAGAFFVLFYTYPLKYIGLGEIARELRHELGARDPDRRHQSRLGENASPQRHGDLWRGAEQSTRPADVEERLVERERFDQRRHFAQDPHH